MKNKTSDRLQKLSAQIMDQWEERTLEEVKAANLQETLALRNSLPIYLTQLVNALSETVDRTHARKIVDSEDSARIGRKHGMERAISPDYTMDQMILEYHILRQVIFDVLEQDEDLSPIDREVIVSSIEQAVNDAATQFSDTLREYQDHLSHTLAHDLRNPLSTIKISAQSLAKQLSSDKSHMDKLNRIIHNTERIDGMIQEILDESRIEAIKRHPEFKDCDLDWLFRDIALEFNISHPDRFQVHSQGKSKGKWNEGLIRRLIENLATNAIKYGQKDAPITLSVVDEAETVTLSVHNLGSPIPKESLSSLFDKFSRGKSAQKKVGWGLGLSVVKSMVEIHKGTIEVESEESKGTIFTIKLPKDPEKIAPPTSNAEIKARGFSS